MRTFFRALVVVAVCGAALAAQAPSKPNLPPPYHTPSADNRSQVVPQPSGARVCR